jgi:D-3-phosphoglycerate dehydrogenase
MKVVAHDPYLDAAESSPVEGVELVGLEELLAGCDFVTLHVPLVDSTRNLISRERLALMKPGARLINAARGGLVDEAAVAEALEAGRLAGAAFDVLAQEPPGADHPLVGRDDVIVTPHLGASSAEAQYNVAAGIAAQICDFLEKGVAHNAVNAPAVPARVLERLAPYVLLTEKMGRFLAQRMERPVRKLEVTLCGEIARQGSGYLPLSVLVGVLRAADVDVNYVNAPLIARDRGVRLLEGSDDEAHSFQSLVKVRATSKGGEVSHLVSGTVFGRAPRFVRIDDLHLDLDPSGTLLITLHHDRPGVLGRIGTLLGQASVNVRRVELGTPETERGALASGFFSLDERPPAETLDAIGALDGVDQVRLVAL